MQGLGVCIAQELGGMIKIGERDGEWHLSQE